MDDVGQAIELADALMGMEDAKRELIEAYDVYMRDGANPSVETELLEAAERWSNAFVYLSHWVSEQQL